ncbi:MAG TPA: response regulator transcription factor [Pseudolysinimonas sp.]|nr:response regulator transcription factor [Pseudolysinimonas sp.]
MLSDRGALHADFRRASGIGEDAADDAAITELLDNLGWNTEAIALATLASQTRTVSEITAALRRTADGEADPRAGGSGPFDRLLEFGTRTYLDTELAEQRAWTALAIFTGTFDINQANRVLAAAGVDDSEDAVGRLLEHGIVVRQSAPDRIRFLVPALFRLPALTTTAPWAAEVRAAARAGLRDWWMGRARYVADTWFGPHQAALFGEIEDSVETLQPLLTVSDPNDEGQIVEILCLLEPFWSWSSRADKAVDWIQAALDVSAPSAEIRFAALWTMTWLAATFDLTRAQRLLKDTEELFPAVAASSPGARARLDRVVGLVALYAGDGERARRLFEQALANGDADGDDGQTVFTLSFLAAAASLAGDQKLAYDYCERSIALCERRGERWLKNFTLWAFALTSWRDGDRHRAYVLALDGIEAATEINDLYAGAMCLEVAAWYEVEYGNPSVGTRVLGVADSLRMTVNFPTLLWGSKELHDEAVRAATAALGAREFQKAFRPEGSFTLRDALGWLREAIAVSPTSPSGAARAVTQLTPRQREIAVLIAEGRSNKEIARLLLITLRTVETHIEHIFAKLNVQSRAQIAAWIAREGSPGHRG